MNGRLTLGALLASAFILAATSVTAAQAAENEETTFIKEAIQGNIGEVEMGKLAQQKGSSAAIKQFGQMLEADHAQALEKARQTASQIGVTPPGDMMPMAKQSHDKLSALSGAEFDREFAKDMVSDHRKDVAEYTKASKMTGPAADYAAQTLPALQKHLQNAEAIASKTASN